VEGKRAVGVCRGGTHDELRFAKPNNLFATLSGRVLRGVKTRKNYCVKFPSRPVRGRKTTSDSLVFVAWCRIDNRWREIVQADAGAQKFQEFEARVQVPN
jgi:hypothetical protein